MSCNNTQRAGKTEEQLVVFAKELFMLVSFTLLLIEWAIRVG
jgi:hypothetical protein